MYLKINKAIATLTEIPSYEERKAWYTELKIARFSLQMEGCSYCIWGTGDILVAEGIDVMPMYFTVKEMQEYLEEVLQCKRLEKEERFYPAGRLESISTIHILYEELIPEKTNDLPRQELIREKNLMRASELNIDLNKHVLYSPEMEKVIREKLSERYDSGNANEVWEKIQLQYAAFLRELPYLGGKKNTHNGTGGTYDCIMLFAYYEVLDPKPSVNELYEMNLAVFLPAFQKLAGVVNANKPLLLRILHLAFAMTAKSKYNKSPKQPTGYIMDVEPYNKTEGVRYYFHRCPIAEFAKEHGYLDIMPAFCNGDYPAMDVINAALIRRHTCTNSNICDYWIVGDQSDIAKKHPRKTDEKGYWYND